MPDAPTFLQPHGSIRARMDLRRRLTTGACTRQDDGQNHFGNSIWLYEPDLDPHDITSAYY